MSEAFEELAQLRGLLTQLTGKHSRMQVVQRIRSLEAEISANTQPIETVPLKMCVDLLMKNVHAAVYDDTEVEYWVIVNDLQPCVSSTLEDLRTNVERAVRDTIKGATP